MHPAAKLILKLRHGEAAFGNTSLAPTPDDLGLVRSAHIPHTTYAIERNLGLMGRSAVTLALGDGGPPSHSQSISSLYGVF